MNATLLPLLCALACPVVMGAAMWLMMRGDRGQPGDVPQPTAANTALEPPDTSPSADDRLAALRAQLGDVETQQAAIAAQVERLGAGDRAAEYQAAGLVDVREPASPPARRSPEAPGPPPPGHSGYCQ